MCPALHMRLVDFNDHRLALSKDPQDDCLGSFGAGADDVPFSGWLMKAVARLYGCLRLILRLDGRSPFENEAELTTGVIVLWAS